MKYLLIVLIARFFEIIFIEHFEGNTQIFLWNVLLLSQPLFLCLAINYYVKNNKAKLVNFVVLLTSIVMLVNFIAEWLFYDYFDNIRLIFSIFIFAILIPLTANVVYKTLTPESVPYDNNKSYLVLKRPCNLCGMFAALFTAPYGHCSIVAQGRWFKFKRGVMKEIKYNENKEHCLVLLDDLDLLEIRKLVGLKWSLKNNCFVIFNKFKK